MVWIMFLWLNGYPAAGISNQEFASKKDCLKAGIALKHQVATEITFSCIEKGKSK